MIRSLHPGRTPWLAIKCTPASCRRASALSAIKAGIRNTQSVVRSPTQSTQLAPWRQKLRGKLERRQRVARSDPDTLAQDLKNKWRKSIHDIQKNLQTMMRRSATSKLDVQNANLSMLKDEYKLSRDDRKALAEWYEAALPPLLDTGRDTLPPPGDPTFLAQQRAYGIKQRELWDRLFEEDPGILGDIKREFQRKIRHIQTLLMLPAIRQAEVDSQHRWINVAKNSHMGRDGEHGTPAQRTLRRAAANTGVQRALRRHETKSQYYRQRGVSWDEMMETSLEYANVLDQGHRDLGFGSGKQTAQFDGQHEEREEREPARTSSAQQHGHQSQQTAGLEDDSYVPISYTRADSEFLYGANSVLAALKAGRRNLHKLYIDPTSRSLASRLRRDQIQRLASDARIPVDTIDQPGKLQMLDKMSQGRPHNGVVLEASPLPFAPVERIMYDSASESMHLVPPQQDGGNVRHYPRIDATRHEGWRQPFVLLLDGILDPGNMGNIIRTAHFYSLTAVAICSNTCAPVGSSVTVKSSSGAIEAIPLINVPFPSNFIRCARDYDWNVFAAVAPPEPWKQATRSSSTDRVLLTTDTHDILARKPAILMLGAEGEGLRNIMLNKATHKISIPGGRGKQNDVGVDSLNVASAAAVLIDALSKKPSSQWPENRTAERPVTQGRGEAAKQAREIEIRQHRDPEELEDDQELFDDDEKNDQEHEFASSKLGSKDGSKLAATEQIMQIKALRSANSEKIAELKLDGRVANKIEIKRLKKENEKYLKDIAAIKKPLRMNNHDVKSFREMLIQRGASTLQTQDPLPASSHVSRPHERVIKPSTAPRESRLSERSAGRNDDRAEEKSDSSFADAAEDFEDSPADVPSPLITKQWSTAKYPIVLTRGSHRNESSPSEEKLQLSTSEKQLPDTKPLKRNRPENFGFLDRIGL